MPSANSHQAFSVVRPHNNGGRPSAVGGRKAVFLDRDGVINRMVYDPEHGTVDSPANPDEFRFLPGVGEAVALLKRLGFLVAVVSNQPGIAKRRFSPAMLEATTDKMIAGIEASGGRIDGVYYCLHHPHAVLQEYRANCDCRKPKPGLVLAAARELGIDLCRSYMVGDGVTDVLAGQAAGVQTIFLGGWKCYHCDELSRQGGQPNYIAASLTEAADIVRLLEAGDHQSASKYGLPCIKAEVATLGERAL